jgi:hypothetical protein
MDLRKTVNHEGQIRTAVPSVRLPEVFLGIRSFREGYGHHT